MCETSTPKEELLKVRLRMTRTGWVYNLPVLRSYAASGWGATASMGAINVIRFASLPRAVLRAKQRHPQGCAGGKGEMGTTGRCGARSCISVMLHMEGSSCGGRSARRIGHCHRQGSVRSEATLSPETATARLGGGWRHSYRP